MRRSEQRRKLEQSATALRRVADWLTEIDDAGEARDRLGETIHEVDQLQDELEQDES